MAVKDLGRTIADLPRKLRYDIPGHVLMKLLGPSVAWWRRSLQAQHKLLLQTQCFMWFRWGSGHSLLYTSGRSPSVCPPKSLGARSDLEPVVGAPSNQPHLAGQKQWPCACRLLLLHHAPEGLRSFINTGPGMSNLKSWRHRPALVCPKFSTAILNFFLDSLQISLHCLGALALWTYSMRSSLGARESV
jgi:hypothetical protein